MLRAKRVLLMVTLLLCLIALPVFAQDAGSAAATATTSDPIGTMTILLGLGLIILVGGRIYMKENGKNGKEVD